jgi:hypothetical protein
LNAFSLVECTANRSASVTLDGLGSTTFDESPIVRYQWFVERNSAASSLAPLGSGLTLTTRLPVGTNVVGLNVYDNVAASGRTTRSIVVRDTVAPVINSPGLGLFHGDGVDEDCNGVWDDVCDPMEFASMETGPLTLMSNEVVVPATLTNLQKNRARAFASKTLPNITPRVCPAPPPPPPPEDIGSPPPQPQPAQGCGCYVSGSLEHSAASIVVFVLALAWTRRRRGGAKPPHDVL